MEKICGTVGYQIDRKIFRPLFMTKEPIKGEGKYMHDKLKTWKERIKKKVVVKMLYTTCIAM